MNSIQLLIQEICEEEGISCHAISKDWILVLEKGEEIHYIAGSHFDCNNYVSAKICNDKYACYEALKYHHLPVLEHHIFYPNDSREEVLSSFHSYQENVVVKANSGSYGDDMFPVTNEEDLFSKMDLLFQKHHSISMSPFYSILHEYRVIVLNQEVELIFGKKRPVVVGDGVHSIIELLREFNEPYFIKVEDSSLHRVLEKGEVYSYGWQHNLSKGSIPYLIEDEKLMEQLKELALQATEKLEDHSFSIIEINSGVVTNIVPYFEKGEEIAKNIYKKAVLSLFSSK